jgi:hypothetical protein
MRHHLKASLCLFCVLLLAACGKGGGDASTGGSSTSLGTNAVKGIVSHGYIKAYQWGASGYTQVASAITDASGNFSLSVPGSSGVFRLDLVLSTDGTPTTMTCDAAVCGAQTFGQQVTLTAENDPGLSTWATVVNGQVLIMPLTPLSTLLVHFAESLGGGHLDPVSLALAEQRLSGLLGLSNEDLLVKPGDVTKPLYVASASPVALKISLLAAAFAQLAQNNGTSIKTEVAAYVAAFADNNGRLQQSGSGQSLAGLLAAAVSVNDQAGATGTAIDDINARLNAASAGSGLTTLPAAAPFDSNALITALGPLGAQIQSVITASGNSTLEQLVLSQLHKFGWLANPDTVGLTSPILVALAYTLQSSFLLDHADSALVFPGGQHFFVGTSTASANYVYASATDRKLYIHVNDGTYQTDLTIGLTAFSAGSTASPYQFSAVGSISDGHVSATVDGSMTIDPTTTNVSALGVALTKIYLGSGTNDTDAVLADFLRTAHGIITVEGSAGLTSIDNANSTLGVQGKASVDINMAGNAGGISASGSVDHGRLTLPNGDYYEVGSGNGDFLNFALGNDGSFAARFTAHVLTLPLTTVSANGTLTALGTWLTSLRDVAATDVSTGITNLLSFLTTLGAKVLPDMVAAAEAFDYSTMPLTLNGEASVGAPVNQVYRLSLANGDLKITQPNSTVVAIEMTFGPHGLLARAGTLWWLFGIDLSNMADPALVVDDQNGGETSISLSQLLALLG